MFDIKAYVNSGIIEQYCLGMANTDEVMELEQLAKQHPEIELAIQAAQMSLGSFLKGFQKKTSTQSRNIIKQGILENLKWENAKLNEDGLLPEYIGISRHTDPVLIESVIKDIPAPAISSYDNVHAQIIFSGGGKELGLFWVKEFVPEEEHPEIEESFMVLEGTADCYIDDQVFKMAKGDFMPIPPQSHHKVIVTSSYPARAIRARLEKQPA